MTEHIAQSGKDLELALTFSLPTPAILDSYHAEWKATIRAWDELSSGISRLLVG